MVSSILLNGQYRFRPKPLIDWSSEPCLGCVFGDLDLEDRSLACHTASDWH